MVIFIIGVTGSGKSTLMQALTSRLGWPGLEADELHSASNIARMRHGIPLDDADRWPWLEAVAAEVSRRTAQEESLVVACSALKKAYRDRLRGTAPKCLFVYLRADLPLVQERLKSRGGHFMPAALAESQFEALEPPGPSEPAIIIPADQPMERSVEQVLAAVNPP